MAALTKQFRSERQEILRHLRHLADTAPAMLWAADRDGKMLWCSDAWLRFTGRLLDQETGEGWLDGVHPDDRTECSQQYQAAIREGRPFHREFRVQVAGGEPRWVASTGLPRAGYGEEPSAVRYVGAFADVTGRRAAEEERDRVLHERDAALHEVDHLLLELERARRGKRDFLREVLRTVTDGRLLLCVTAQDLPRALPLLAGPVLLTPESGSDFRDAIRAGAQACGLPAGRIFDLVVGAGEAAANAVAHGGGGTGRVCGDPAAGRVQVWVEDHGHGIDPALLPRATLERGFSGDGGFGYGFWMIFHAVDRTYLLTGRHGTTVVLEHGREPRAAPAAPTILGNSMTEHRTNS